MANLTGDSNDPGVAAIFGIHNNPNPGDASIIGQSNSHGRGVLGISKTAQGVWGASESDAGTVGASRDGVGIFGGSTTNVGVRGETESGFAGIHGIHKGTGFAGFFKGTLGVDGDVNVNKSVNVMGDVKLVGGDLAEEFGVVGNIEAEPGSVVVLAGDDSVRVSDQPYDRRVAGVVSGAGSFRPGLILDRQSGIGRRPLALTGKVWCKVDAEYGAIKLGDLLTTSSTPGHAMRAEHKDLAFGAVIGKALGDFPAGRGILPILVALQ